MRRDRDFFFPYLGFRDVSRQNLEQNLTRFFEIEISRWALITTSKNSIITWNSPRDAQNHQVMTRGEKVKLGGGRGCSPSGCGHGSSRVNSWSSLKLQLPKDSFIFVVIRFCMLGWTCSANSKHKCCSHRCQRTTMGARLRRAGTSHSRCARQD